MKADKKENPARKKRATRAVIVLLILAVVLPLTLNYIVMATTQNRIITADVAANLDADAILVLGARVWDNGQPSGILKDRIRTIIKVAHPDFRQELKDKINTSPLIGEDDWGGVDLFDNVEK